MTANSFEEGVMAGLLLGGGNSGKEPVIKALSVTENGVYTPPSGVDGYAPVSVLVSDRYDEGYQKGYDDGYDDGYRDGFQYASDIVNGQTTPQEETLPNGDTVTFPNGYVPTDDPNNAADLAKTFTGLADGDNTGTAVNLDNGYKLVVENTPFSGTFPSSADKSYHIYIVDSDGTKWSLGVGSAYPSFYQELVDFWFEDGKCYRTYTQYSSNGTSITTTVYTLLTGSLLTSYNEWASGTNYGCGVGVTA